MSHLSVLGAGWVMKCCAYAGTKLIWPNVKSLAVEIQISDTQDPIIKIKIIYLVLFTTVLLVCTRPVTQIYFVFPSSWCRWLSATTGLLFFLKRQSLVAVCSRGSAHFLQHAAQSAESRAVSAFVESVMQLLWHTMALGRLVGWRRFRMQDHLAAYGWPGYTDSHTHWWLCLYLSTDSRLFESFFLSLPLL